MTNTYILMKAEHGSLKWLQQRHRDKDGRCIIGSSEVATVMLANDYETPVDLAVRKLRPPVVTEPNDAMVRGNVLEPALITYASMQLGRALFTPAVMFGKDRIISTLDAVATVQDSQCFQHLDIEQIVECKTANRWAHDDAVPASWWWQAQAQMHATCHDRVTFSVLDRNLRLGLFTVQRDETAITAMLREVETFCSVIDSGNVPTDLPLTMQQVAALYPKPQGETELPADVLQDIEEWNAVKDAIKDLEAQERRIKDKLADALRDAEFGTVNGARVLSYKAQTSTRLDTKGLAFAHPEVTDAFMTATTYRVLRTMK